MLRCILRIAPLLFIYSTLTHAAELPPTKAIIVDSTGKEVTLSKWSFAGGTRKLVWAPDQPDVLELRELNSTTFKDGILTFVPVSRIQFIEYEATARTIQVRVAGLKEPLIGSTRFAGINSITIEAETKVGDAGVADVRYRGGVAKGGIRSLRFPDTKPDEPKWEGELFTVHIAEAKGSNSNAIVRDLVPLYLTAEGEKPMPNLMFKKTLRVEMAKIQKFTVVQPPDKVKSAECELIMKDGQELGLTLLNAMPLDEKKSAPLLGFVGKVPGGYRLFPVHTISGFQQGMVEEEKK